MGKARVTELKNVDVGFVSFVTEGANGQKFQIFKSKNFKETSKRKSFKSQASIKKARYTMRELIESIVRGMFTEPKTVPMLPDNSSDSQAEKISPKKETVTMDQILQAIMTLRDEIITAIGGARPAGQEPPPAAQPAPGASNSISDTDVAFAKGADGTAPQTPAGTPPATPATTSAAPVSSASASPQTDTTPAGAQPVPAAQAPTTPSQATTPPTVSQQPADQITSVAATQKTSDEIAALSSMVAALAKQMESLAGKVEAIAKQRSISNAIPEGSEPTSRRGVQKAANADGTPDFSNIFA